MGRLGPTPSEVTRNRRSNYRVYRASEQTPKHLILLTLPRFIRTLEMMKFVYPMLVSLAFASSAMAQSQLQGLEFEGLEDSLDFIMSADQEIDPALAEAQPGDDASVLIIRVGGVTAPRQWVQTGDPAIKRVLLHPAKTGEAAAILRIRFNGPVVNDAFFENITVFPEDGALRVSLPRPKGSTPTAPSPAAPAASPAAAPQPAADPAAAQRRMLDATPAPRRLDDEDVEFETMELPPGAPTANVWEGFNGLSLRLQTGMNQRYGAHRIAVMPFVAIDELARKNDLPAVSAQLLAARLRGQPGILEVDHELVRRSIRPLGRDAMGRIAVDEAREVALLIGADTLITGTVSADGTGYAIDARAMDIDSGRYMAMTRQQFDGETMRDAAGGVREFRTYGGSVFRSFLLPGWGQMNNGDVGRGIIYNTLFWASAAGAVTYSLLGTQAQAEYGSRMDVHNERRTDANVYFARANTLYLSIGILWLTSFIDILATAETSTVYDVSSYEGNPDDNEGANK